MESVYPGVFRLQHNAGANGYVILAGANGDPGRVAVIDPGMPWAAGGVLRELAEGGLLSAVTDILVTHADIDHIGAAPAVQAATGAAAWLGRADAELLDGRRIPADAGVPHERS